MKSLKWHLRFIDLARSIASWSKDRSTQVGAVAVGPNLEICSVGYNGFPRGVNDDVDERHQRPAKYAWTEHAERNCVFNASRIGVSLEGKTLYCTHFPCPDCARGIIQSGITSFYYPEDKSEEGKRFRERTYESQLIALEMLQEAGVQCRIIKEFSVKLEQGPNYCACGVKPEDLMP